MSRTRSYAATALTRRSAPTSRGLSIRIGIPVRIEDTVDYAEVCDVANLVAQQRSYKTLERLCAAIADRLLEQYAAQAVWVKAAKPEPPLAFVVSEVSVEVWREAE